MPETPTFGRYSEIPYDEMTPEQQEGYRFLVDPRPPRTGCRRDPRRDSPAIPIHTSIVPGPVPTATRSLHTSAREVPELGLNLPSNAVGKDFLLRSVILASPPSGSGFQVSLYGLAGLLLAVDEGFELN